jgi:hypothetical protein
MLLRFQKAAVRGNYGTGNQAFSMRLRFLTIRDEKYRKFLEKRPDILQITEKPDDHQQRGARNQPKNSSVGRLKVQMVKMLFATRYHWRPALCAEPARPPVPIACNTKERRTDNNTNECRVNQHGDRQRKSDHLDH